MMKKIIVFSVIGLVVSLSAIGGEKVSANSDNRTASAQQNAIRMIRYSFTVSNPTNKVIESVYFWAYGPVKETATQYVTDITASHSFNLRQDKWGNQTLEFEFAKLPPFSSKVITVTAQVKLRLPQSQYLEDADLFLKEEPFIEISHPKIKLIAKAVRTDSAIETATRSYRWAADNVQYSGYISDNRGAVYAVEQKRGDCTESMYLFTALARSNQIPARGIGGFVVDRDGVVLAEDYHNWSEFYLDEIWNLADPQKKRFQQTPKSYIAMRVFVPKTDGPMESTHRFAYTGSDLDVVMN